MTGFEEGTASVSTSRSECSRWIPVGVQRTASRKAGLHATNGFICLHEHMRSDAVLAPMRMSFPNIHPLFHPPRLSQDARRRSYRSVGYDNLPHLVSVCNPISPSSSLECPSVRCTSQEQQQQVNKSVLAGSRKEMLTCSWEDLGYGYGLQG